MAKQEGGMRRAELVIVAAAALLVALAYIVSRFTGS
jgi:hypothetical protein